MLIRLGKIRSELKNIFVINYKKDVVADQLSLFEEYDRLQVRRIKESNLKETR